LIAYTKGWQKKIEEQKIKPMTAAEAQATRLRQLTDQLRSELQEAASSADDASAATTKATAP